MEAERHFALIGAPRPGSSLLIFFLLTFGVMWTCFIAVAVTSISAHTALGQLLLLLGTFSPSLAALLLTGRAEGRAGQTARAERRMFASWGRSQIAHRGLR